MIILLIAVAKVALLIALCYPVALLCERWFSRWAIIDAHREAIREMAAEHAQEPMFWRWLRDEYPEDAARYDAVRRSARN